MSPRRFEFVGGPSRKFWEIRTTDCSVTVCFGRIGTAGQSQTKRFGSAAAAIQHTEKLIASKTRKGYAEVA